VNREERRALTVLVTKGVLDAFEQERKLARQDFDNERNLAIRMAAPMRHAAAAAMESMTGHDVAPIVGLDNDHNGVEGEWYLDIECKARERTSDLVQSIHLRRPLPKGTHERLVKLDDAANAYIDEREVKARVEVTLAYAALVDQKGIDSLVKILVDETVAALKKSK
jgi:hypothetical protein